MAIETKFGWVLNGPLYEKASQYHVTVVNETKTYVLNLYFEPTKISDPPYTKGKIYAWPFYQIDSLKQRKEVQN